VTIHGTNTTGSELTVFEDVYGTPLWLRVGQPELALNMYGGSSCGDSSVHDDPFFNQVPLAPGASVEFSWDGSYKESESDAGGCIATRHAAPGAFPSRACAYVGNVPPNTDPFLDAGAPQTCVSFTITLPAAGSTTVTTSF
jgi:hypothetical protein